MGAPFQTKALAHDSVSVGQQHLEGNLKATAPIDSPIDCGGGAAAQPFHQHVWAKLLTTQDTRGLSASRSQESDGEAALCCSGLSCVSVINDSNLCNLDAMLLY